MSKILMRIVYYNAVKAAKKPKIIPGAFAMATGRSRFSLKSPYATQSVQLSPAINGCMNEPLCPERLLTICGK